MQREVTLKFETIFIGGASVGQRTIPLWDGPAPDDVVLTGPFRRADGTLYATAQTKAEYEAERAAA